LPDGFVDGLSVVGDHVTIVTGDYDYLLSAEFVHNQVIDGVWFSGIDSTGQPKG